MRVRMGMLRLTQEQIVLATSPPLFVSFAAMIKGFLAADNLFALIQNVSIPGILRPGLAVGIFGRGIDLAIVTTTTMTVAWVPSLAGLAFAADRSDCWRSHRLCRDSRHLRDTSTVECDLRIQPPGLGRRRPDLRATERQLDAHHRRRRRVRPAEQRDRLPPFRGARLLLSAVHPARLVPARHRGQSAQGAPECR
jgi:hypothetical protein